MVKLFGLGIVLQILASGVVGTRLLLLWRRTREAPELAFGSSFLLLGVLGYPLSIAARSGVGGVQAAGMMLAIALAAQDLSALTVAIGTWRTFDSSRRWIGVVLAVASMLFVASLVGHAVTVGFAGGRDGGSFYYLGFWLRFSAYAWSCWAAFRCYGQLRRRSALGLADPVATDRIRLWAFTTLFICAGFAIFLAGRLMTSNVGESVPVLLVTSAVAIGAAVAMSLAFFPPRAYLLRIERA